MWLSAQSVKAFEGMRSIRTTPRRSGRRARNWSESLSEKERRNEMREKTKLGGAFTFAGTSLTVNRIGYGAMQLAGRDGDKMVWGPPRDIPGAIAVLREAVASGVNHIDTSDFYGPHITNQLIRRALHPYPDNLVIVTKVSARRGEDGSWLHARSRQEIIDAVHDNLRNLGVDSLDVVNLRVGGIMEP